MTGVQADADADGRAGCRDGRAEDRVEVLEAMPEVVALARRVLEQDHRLAFGRAAEELV